MAVGSFFNTLLGNLQVEETPQFIRVSGIRPALLIEAIQGVWKSSKVSNNIIKAGSTEFAFHKFLLPDMVYVLETIAKEKYLRVSRRLVIELIEKLKTETWLKSVYVEKHDNIVDFKQLSKFTVQPLPHQRQYMEFYNDVVPKYKLKGHLLSAGVGVGKTLNSLFLMECLKCDTIVCIVPKNSLENVWAKTLSECFKNPVSFWVSSRMKPLDKGYRYYVTHYENLGNMVEFFKGEGSKLGKVGVVVDEVHFLNEIKSTRTQKYLELVGPTCLNSQNILAMSGTPIKAMATELIPTLRALDPMFVGKAEEIFLNVFGKSTLRALDIISHRLGFMAYRVDKADVVPLDITRWTIQVPLKNGNEYTLDTVRMKMRDYVRERMEYYRKNEALYHDHYFAGIALYEKWLFTSGSNTEKAQYKTYQDYIKTIRKGFDAKMMKVESVYCNAFEKNNILPHLEGDFKKNFKKAKSVYKYVELTILGEALGLVLAKIREQCNIDIALGIENAVMSNNATNEKHIVSISDLINDATKKTIFFTNFVGVVSALEERLKSLGFKPLVVYGDTNKDLPKITKEFAENPDANPLIATFQSLSTAVPLTMANRVVMLNNPWRPHDYVQAESRAARLGQDSPVSVIDVFLDTKGVPNVSTRSKEVLDWASENVAAMLGVKVDVEQISTESIDVDEVKEQSLMTEHPLMDMILSNEDLKDTFETKVESIGKESLVSTVSLPASQQKQYLNW